MGGRYSLGIDEQIDVFFDITSSLLSGTNNEIGANKEFSDCEGNKYLGVVQSVNSGADFVSMATPGTAIGDLATKYGKRLGVLQLLIKKLNGDEPTIGDYFAAAASFVSGPLAIGLTIVGLGYTILSYKEDPPRACPNPNRNRNDENPNLKDAKNASSPIILDLNGDGIKTTGIASWRYFDHDQSGFAEMTAWADKNDGILALDLNGNGKIDDGREIFGNNTFLPDGTLAPHGYAALAQYDSNHDGKIDSHDEIWEKLRVWRDKNEDAKTGKNELHTLDELGIAAINLNAEEVSETDEAGNRVTHRATVTKTDGTTMASADVWFNVNTAQTRYLGDETVSEDIAALPNVRGFGNVPSLHVAMNKDSKLKEMVETYLSTDSEHRDALLPEIIYKWTGSENIVSNSRGRHIDARTLAALERLTGDTFLQNGRDPNPNTNAARILQDEFDKFSRYTEAKILLQKPEYANARSIMDFLIDRADANDEPVNWDLFAQYLSQVNKAGQTKKVKTEYRLIEGSLTYSSKYKDSLQNFFTQHAEDYSELFFSVIKSITGDETSNTLVGSSKSDAILGLAGDDTLEGNAGNDYLNGSLGNDKLYGGTGHDTLDGGTGNDQLYGGNNESDTYLFHAGHGRDVINDYASQDEQADTLRFAGAQLKNAQFSREGHDLAIRAYGNEQDQVNIQGFFWYTTANVNYYNLQFDDATLTRDDIAGLRIAGNGTDKGETIYGWKNADVIDAGAGDDSVYGYENDDELSGGEGNDRLYGGNGNDKLSGDDGNDELAGEKGDDQLSGGAGDDKLTGGAGHDTLDGGSGNDYMEGGGYESDTYLFRAGHDKDTVSDYAIEDKDADTLRFSGAKAAGSRYRRGGYHLIVNAYGENDAVTLNNYFHGDNYQRYNFQFEDAVVQRKDFIAEKTLEVSGTEKNDSLQGWVTKDVIHGGAGNDSISADAGDDLLHGDSGDDILYGNQGQDTLHGDEGNDRLYGGEGSDILDGGAGNDLLDGGSKERDTYLFRAGHGKDTVSDYAIEDKDADTLRFSGAKAADSRYRREGYHLIVNAYGENDAVTLNNYFHGDNYQRYNFQFDDATFKAAELRGKDLPTEGLKAPVAATAQTTDAAMPDSATAAVTPQENAATATADESKAQAAKASEKIIEVDTFHPPLQLHKDDTASTGAAQKADNATVSGNNAGKNVLAAQTPANMANPSAATNAASAATAPASDKPQTAAVASADSSAASKADTQSATVQQNAESVNAALKTGGAAATPASTLDAKAAQQSQQMLSAMATQSQTATPTALAAPDLQPKPQLVASQV